VDLRREDEQIAWLERKGREQCGFRLLRVQANSEVPNVRTQPEDRMTGQRGSDRLTFGSVLFEGELEITGIEQFRRALEFGIGSGKAYGFGLLSVARSV
jgi:CRISPR system Cascade subunit CasE